MKIKYLKKSTMIIFSFFMLIPISYAEEKGAEPPQEMVDACKEMQVGDACTYYDNKSKKVSGNCIKDGRVVICYPEETKKEGQH